MKEYDVIVIGNGSGGHIAHFAAREGYRVALVDEPPVGGTCQNYGCKPSKSLIYAADKLLEVSAAGAFGIDVTVNAVDAAGILAATRAKIAGWQSDQMSAIEKIGAVDYYAKRGEFVDDYLVAVGDDVLTGEKIFIANGARPLVPPIDGLGDVDVTYLTNETVFELETVPASMVIIGGGYISVEFAHFFAAMGVEVTIVQRGDRLVKGLDREVSERLYDALSERMTVLLNTDAKRVARDGENGGDGYRVIGRARSGEERVLSAEALMLAVGRHSNADRLAVEKTGVETDRRGYVRVNDYLETSQQNIWAMGDITGRAMFKYVANREATLAWNNATHGEKRALDHTTVPTAIFTYPQIASVGLTEEAAVASHDILVGRAEYTDIVKGRIQQASGLVKSIVERGSERILGFHVIGPHAPLIVQEMVYAIKYGGTAQMVIDTIHLFPSLSEVVQASLRALEPAGP